MSKELAMNSKSKTIFIVALLAVLSLGTVYFSKKGVDYRQQQLKELDNNYGRIDFSSEYGSYNIIPSTLSGKVGVVSFIFRKDDIDPLMIQLGRIHEQFNAREDVLLVTNVVRDPTDSIPYIDQIFERNGMVQDLSQWIMNAGDLDMVQDLARTGYFLNQIDGSTPIHIVIDDQGVIRNIYNAHNADEVRNMIQHITTLLPRKRDADIKVKR